MPPHGSLDELFRLAKQAAQPQRQAYERVAVEAPLALRAVLFGDRRRL